MLNGGQKEGLAKGKDGSGGTPMAAREKRKKNREKKRHLDDIAGVPSAKQNKEKQSTVIPNAGVMRGGDDGASCAVIGQLADTISAHID